MREAAFEQFRALERDHWWFRGRRAVYLELLRGALGGRRPRRVLDVGAGLGGFLPPLSELSGALAFTELDPSAAREAQGRGGATGLRARAEALPFLDESQDLVCLFDVVEHADDDGQVLEEVARVLRPGGTVILSVPAHPWLYSRNDEVAGHRRRYTRRSLTELVTGAELTLLRCTHANALLFPAIAAAVLALKAVEPLVPRSEHTNLSWRPPRLVDELCFRAFRAELALSRRIDLPVGHSLVAIARRQELGPVLRPLPTRLPRRAVVRPSVG
jgi:SAM-dependent methyltransferase